MLCKNMRRFKFTVRHIFVGRTSSFSGFSWNLTENMIMRSFNKAMDAIDKNFNLLS
jgi:hypothetical protein